MSAPFYFKIIRQPFPEALSSVEAALKQNGFGIISKIDFQAAFKEKIQKETLRSLSLGACNPMLAWKVYQKDESLAVMLPCHITVQEQADGSTKITFIDPQKMFHSFMEGSHPELKEIADVKRTKMMDIHEFLTFLSTKDADKRLRASFNALQ